MKIDMESYKYLLSGLLILNFIKHGISMPTVSSTVNMDDDVSMAGDASYTDDYADEEPNTVEPKTIETNIKPTAAPYFPTNKTDIHSKMGDDVVLDCNPINFSGNVVFWYKGETLIVSGHANLNSRFKLISNNKLTIPNATEMDADKYYCEVFPHQIRHEFDIMIMNDLPESIETNQLNAESISASTESGNGSKTIEIKSFTFISLVLGMLIFLRI